MWGNFGAAIQPPIIAWALKTWGGPHDYRAGFVLSGLAFVLSGVLALGINASRPLVERE
jgi:hypothetical protein